MRQTPVAEVCTLAPGGGPLLARQARRTEICCADAPAVVQQRTSCAAADPSDLRANVPAAIVCRLARRVRVRLTVARTPVPQREGIGRSGTKSTWFSQGRDYAGRHADVFDPFLGASPAPRRSTISMARGQESKLVLRLATRSPLPAIVIVKRTYLAFGGAWNRTWLLAARGIAQVAHACARHARLVRAALFNKDADGVPMRIDTPLESSLQVCSTRAGSGALLAPISPLLPHFFPSRSFLCLVTSLSW